MQGAGDEGAGENIKKGGRKKQKFHKKGVKYCNKTPPQNCLKTPLCVI